MNFASRGEPAAASELPIPEGLLLAPGTHRMQGSNAVRFAPNVIDNESMNKKKSKVCCIFRSEHEHCDHSRNNYERL